MILKPSSLFNIFFCSLFLPIAFSACFHLKTVIKHSHSLLELPNYENHWIYLRHSYEKWRQPDVSTQMWISWMSCVPYIQSSWCSRRTISCQPRIQHGGSPVAVSPILSAHFFQVITASQQRIQVTQFRMSNRT